MKGFRNRIVGQERKSFFNGMGGRFIQHVGDFTEFEAYKLFSSLKVNSLYRWSMVTWNGHADDLIIYIEILDGRTLKIGCSSTEHETPNMLRVGAWRAGSPKLDFKSKIKNMFFGTGFLGKRFPIVKTREICNYMKWDIDDDDIGDWIC